MNTMTITRLQRFTSCRQLHTIVAREIIKPSSPTPPHLKTHVLSRIDSFFPHYHIPFVFFYKNYNHGDVKILKESLSQCLTHYYPLAGRFSTPSLYQIDSNDEGVEFVEASHDIGVHDFILKRDEDKTLLQLFSNISQATPNLLAVQLNHFIGGGVALAVTVSHIVADGSAVINFLNQWATVTRGGEVIKPNIISSSVTYSNVPIAGFKRTYESEYVTRSFVFPNEKLEELKRKCISMGTYPTPPTRVEVLTSLLFKCSVDAAITKAGGVFNPVALLYPLNLRDKAFMNDPALGNLTELIAEMMSEPSEVMLNEVVSKLKKTKMQNRDPKDIEGIAERYRSVFSLLGGNPSLKTYWMTSLCGFSLYELDFGWGKPIQANCVYLNLENKTFYIMDTPQRDGLEAMVCLPQEEIMMVQKDKELLTYVKD